MLGSSYRPTSATTAPGTLAASFSRSFPKTRRPSASKTSWPSPQVRADDAKDQTAGIWCIMYSEIQKIPVYSKYGAWHARSQLLPQFPKNQAPLSLQDLMAQPSGDTAVSVTV